MSRTHLYMLAIMPPAEIVVPLREEQVLLFQHYGCKAAMKPPVHATVYEPFHAAEDIEGRFLTLKNIVSHVSPFEVKLHNYNFFDNLSMRHPVVYVAVKDNPILKKLQRDVLAEVNRVRKASSRLTSYTPHFTIGYRDVSWDSFPQIKSEYSQKTFKGSFSCNAIFLWKHDGEKWQVHDTFNFESNGDDNIIYGRQLELF